MSTNKIVAVTCRHCGSDRITHATKYIVRNLIIKPRFEINELLPHREIYVEEFGPDEILSDSAESVDYPYDCKGCGAVEMSEEDLLIDGENHPDYIEDDEEEDSPEEGEPGQADLEPTGS